ncbi:MAG: hypothetical protein RI885_1163 [Actinomycetota bacterium]|jgi:large subunit ribosomal protein L25
MVDKNNGGLSSADRAGTSKSARKSSENNKIVAEVRESFGKGAARKLRAVGKIPAVVYGHGTDVQHLTLPGHEVALLLRKANAVLDLDIAGTAQLALVKDVQKDPVKQIIEHIDLVVIRRGEKVTIDVPVHLEGESFAGTIANLDTTALSIEAEATHIPERIVIDIEGLEEGVQITAADVTLPAGSTLITDPEVLVVGIVVPQLDLTSDAVSEDEETEGDDAEGDADSESAEGDDAEKSE